MYTLKELFEYFSSAQFMPHGYCYHWIPSLVTLHVVSDGVIALSYMMIPFTLAYFVSLRRDVPFGWIFICFSAFIIACGTTHLAEIWTLWHADYWMSGFIKALTAIISFTTAILLIRLVPFALELPSPAMLEKANVLLGSEIEIRKKKKLRLKKPIIN